MKGVLREAGREYNGRHPVTVRGGRSTVRPPGALYRASRAQAARGMQQLGSTIALNRFGLGARPGELASVGGDGRDWLRAQLTHAPPAVGAGSLATAAQLLGQ